MRVLVLLPEAFGGRGGIAAYNRDLLTAMASVPRIEEIVVLPRSIRGEVESLPSKIVYKSEAAGGKLRYLQNALKVIRKEAPFDLVICGHVNLLPIACIAKRKFQAELMLFIYGIDAWQPTGRVLRDVAVASVSSVVSISQYTLEKFKRWADLSDSVQEHLLPCTVDLDRFTPGEKDSQLAQKLRISGRKVLLTIARLAASERYKGVDQVIEALPKLIAADSSICYVVCGDGDDRSRLEEKVRLLGLEESVIFAGYIPEEEKVKYLRLADVFVMPSSKEGFGIVFLEALACGTPVIAGRAGGSVEALAGGELGELVNPKSQTELLAAIRKLFDQPAVNRQLLEQFSFSAFEQRVQALFT